MDERYKLYPSDNWKDLPFDEVSRQFYHNLAIASEYVDRVIRSQKASIARKNLKMLGI